MQRYLGDILVRKGYIKSNNLEYALNYQIKKILSRANTNSTDLSSLLEIARRKYNRKNDFLLGKILAELKLTKEKDIQEALDIQKNDEEPFKGSKLTLLNQILSRINSTYSLIDLLNRIMVYACRIAKAESSSFVMYDHNRDKLVILIPTGPKADIVNELEIPPEEGIVGWVYTNKKSLIINNAQSEERFYRKIDAISGYTTRQILCVPLRVKNKLIGALEVINKKGNKNFNKNDQLFLEIFSQQSGIAIENTRLYYQKVQLEMENKRVREMIPSPNERIDSLRLIARSYLNDLQKALVPIRGYAQLIKTRSRNTQVKKYACFIENEMQQITDKTDDILQFTRKELQISKRRSKLIGIIEDFREKVWSECRLHRIELKISVDSRIEITADPDKFVRCLIHLFNNSMDAMPQGGIISIKALKNQEGETVITVQDTGSGIDKEVFASAFNPLFSHNRKHGAGMGLPICRRIIEAHNGRINIDDNSEKGALVKIVLPA